MIRRYEGHIAQYLGDGLLVYFGYPAAHEDDAQRAVRTGLEIVAAIQHVPLLHVTALQVRIGIHTGLVVVGEMGRGQARTWPWARRPTLLRDCKGWPSQTRS